MAGSVQNWFAPPGYGLSETALAKPDTLIRENHPPAALGEKVREKWSFRRSNYFEFVGNECRHVHEKVGILDMSAFSKFMVEGHDTASWLDSLLANRIPRKIGRIGLCHLLTPLGGVRSEFTVYRLAEDRFYLISAGMLERHDWDYLTKALPVDGRVQLRKVTSQYGVSGCGGSKFTQPVTEVDG